MTSLVELRILEGPNLYFPRAAVKLTLDVSTITEAGEDQVLRFARRIGLRTTRPGAPGSGFRSRFAVRAVERLVRAEAATWLDRELLSAEPEPVRDAGFGREVKGALAQRRQWLIDQELAREEQGALVTNAGLLSSLRRREIAGAAAQLRSELGLGWREVGHEGTAQGTLARRVDLASGRFALLADSLEFSLVPWRPEMGQRIGRELSVRVRGGGVSWTMGRDRSGPQFG